jgi:PPOX class probable F420-dependent enzyme
MELNEIGDPTYIALETFKKSGEAVNTPVWVTREGEKLDVWTQGNSWKVKRIRNNPHVRVAVSDSRGNPQSDWVDAHAVVQATPDLEAAQRNRMVRKYGMLFRAFALMAKVRRTRDDYVAIEISRRPITSTEDSQDQC